MRRLLLLIAGILALSLANGASAAALGASDRARANDALLFAKKDRWDDALLHAKRASDPLLYKVVQWMYYLSGDSEADFDDITRFIEANPNWPSREKLVARAEASLINANYSDDAVRAWFDAHPPAGGDGKSVYAAILARSGQPLQSEALIKMAREGWVDGNFDGSYETFLLDKFGKMLRAQDHINRADRLLWEQKWSAAERMTKRLPGSYSGLIRARIALQKGQRNASLLAASVGKDHRSDPGLLFDQIEWYKARKGGDGAIRQILLSTPVPVPYPHKWWPHRERAIHQALERHDYLLATRLCSNHAQTSGPEQADALWLTGWILLEYRKKPDDAYKSFYTLYNEANYPVTKSRGAYWAGRAAEKNGNRDIAAKWFEKAAAYPTTFYGQLAHSHVKKNHLSLPDPIAISKTERGEFAKKEFARAYRLLIEADADDIAYKFLHHMMDNASSEREAALIADLGVSTHKRQAGVKASKRALQRNNYVLIDTGYPQPSLPASLPIERALALAIIRQESEFDASARSRSNALGLMQLLPSTAKEIARKTGISFSQARLFEAEFNVRLGAHYLGRLIDQFDGSYVLAIAAYNAGPGNVRKWEKEFGTPGKTLESAVDWVENIPFDETRNYVQRVMENMQVYRQLGPGGTRVALALREDLLR